MGFGEILRYGRHKETLYITTYREKEVVGTQRTAWHIIRLLFYSFAPLSLGLSGLRFGNGGFVGVILLRETTEFTEVGLVVHG